MTIALLRSPKHSLPCDLVSVLREREEKTGKNKYKPVSISKDCCWQEILLSCLHHSINDLPYPLHFSTCRNVFFLNRELETYSFDHIPRQGLGWRMSAKGHKVRRASTCTSLFGHELGCRPVYFRISEEKLANHLECRPRPCEMGSSTLTRGAMCIQTWCGCSIFVVCTSPMHSGDINSDLVYLYVLNKNLEKGGCREKLVARFFKLALEIIYTFEDWIFFFAPLCISPITWNLKQWQLLSCHGMDF